MCHGVRLLVVSDDYRVRNLIENSLEAEGHQALCVSSSDEALHAFGGETKWDFLLLDVNKRTNLDRFFTASLFQRIESEKVCILTEVGNSSWKVHSQRWNIGKILIKPLLRQDLDRLVSQSPNANAISDIPAPITRKQHLPFHLEELDSHGFFLASSPVMMRMYKDIRTLAPFDYPVLILGESGVGKEVVARLLHKYNQRAKQNFVNVNTAAIPSELLESELFGYEAGAFTGAVREKPGKFEIANKGTLLLDEIGEMSLQMQAKLLHVLQDGSFSRLGARHTTQTDVRILAATNVNMEAAIADKRFREDLYYRLNAFTITVPPLRERREEIPQLIEQMALRGSASTGREPYDFSSQLIEAAQEYHWPGNLRELRNFVTRLIVLQDQDSAYNDLRAKTRTLCGAPEGNINNQGLFPSTTSPHLGLKGVVNNQKLQTEGRMIKEALSATGWNRRRAATNLNISYRALLYKIQQHNLTA